MALFKPVWQTDAIKTDSGASDKKIQKALLEIEGIQEEGVLLQLACDPTNRGEIRDAAASCIAGSENRVQLLLHPAPSLAMKLETLRQGLPPEIAAGFLLLYEQSALEAATAQGTAIPAAGTPVETALLEPTHCFDQAIIDAAAECVRTEELKWRVYERARTQAVQYIMIRHMNDEQMLVAVATYHPQAAMRLVAIEKIPQNSASLAGFVLKDTHPEIVQAALARITDEDLLLQVVYESTGERRQAALVRIQDPEKLAQAYLRLNAYDDVPAELLFTTKNQALLHKAVEHGIQRAQGTTGVEWFGWMNYIAAALQNCRDRKTLCRVADKEDLQPRVRIEAYSRLSGERRLLWADLIELLEPKEAPDSEISIAERQAAAVSLNIALAESESLRKPEAFIQYVRAAIEESGCPGGPSF